MTVMDRLFSFPYLIRTSGKVNLTAKQARLGDEHSIDEYGYWKSQRVFKIYYIFEIYLKDLLGID